MKIYLLCICILISFCSGLFNPGVLVTVPFPLKPPQINLNLPIKIDPILINQLELSQINLKSLVYQWQFTQQTATVKISDTKILFKWSFKADKGQGTFTQTQYQLSLNYKFKQNNKGKIQIDITSTKSKLGHSSVHLGGNAPETVIVQVTNLIMNHAAITFRKTIQNAISNGIKSFSSILDTDIKINCQNFTQKVEKCVYINTTLVAPPIISNKTLLIQINGAPYSTGQSSGQLNPDSILVKTNSTNIQLQVHLKLIQQTVKKVFSIMPQNLQFAISEFSSVADINSLTISPAFPKMAQFPTIQDVIFSVKLPNIDILFNSTSQLIQLNGNTQLTVLTKNKTTKNPIKYMKQCNITFSAALQIIYGWKSSSSRVQKLVMKSLDCEQQDIHQGFVDPDAYYAANQPLLTFLRNAFNGGLNRKLVNLEFRGIQGILIGKLVQNVIRADLILSQSVQRVSQSSKVQILLQD